MFLIVRSKRDINSKTERNNANRLSRLNDLHGLFAFQKQVVDNKRKVEKKQTYFLTDILMFMEIAYLYTRE